MRTAGRIVGAFALFEGIVSLIDGNAFLRGLNDKGDKILPEPIKRFNEDLAGLSPATLRGLGLLEVGVGVLLLALSRRS